MIAGLMIYDCGSLQVEVTTTDDTLPTGAYQRTISYQAPFDKCDRVEDYRTAWEYFSQKD
jgi:hypothetical protein